LSTFWIESGSGETANLAAAGEPSVDVQRELNNINSDIQSLRNTFQLLTIGDVMARSADTPFNWKVELMMLVLEPVMTVAVNH
jgi:hypothetical protein